MSYFVCPVHGVNATDLDMDTGEMFCWECSRTEEDFEKYETLEEAQEASTKFA